jgi:hypothetical protein
VPLIVRTGGGSQLTPAGGNTPLPRDFATRDEPTLANCAQLLIVADEEFDLAGGVYRFAELISHSPAFLGWLWFATLRSTLPQNGKQGQRHIFRYLKNGHLRSLAFIVVGDA